MNKTEFKSAHIPFRLCFKLAIKNMWKKKFRFLAILLICGISLAFLSFTIELNGDKLRQNVYTMIENGYQYTDIKQHIPLDKDAIKKDYYNKFNAVELSENSYQKIKHDIPELNVHCYEHVTIDYAGKNAENATFFYPGKIQTIIQYDSSNSYQLLAGRLPKENAKEILITDYLVAAFNHFNVMVNNGTYYDYLYKYIDLNLEKDYQIVGIINTNYEKWLHLTNPQITEINPEEKENYSFLNDFVVMNSIVIPNPYFNKEKVDLSGNLVFTKNGVNRSEWLLTSETDTDIRTYNPDELVFRKDGLGIAYRYSYFYGVVPTQDNEIAIPKQWVKPLFDIEFGNIRRNDWENKIRGQKISLTLTSADHIHTVTKEFTVVGIVNSESKCLVTESLYNELQNTFSQTIERVLTELPTNPTNAYKLFNKAYHKGYVINVWAYQEDIESYMVDPFISIVSKAGLFVFAAFTMGIMWTIITIEIVDSKKEIGILRSIGLSGIKVSFIFIIQTLIINILAYILSIFLAKYAIEWYNVGITDQLNVISLYMYTITYRTPLYLFLFVILMTLISTCLPLYKIMSQKIIDVINERE